MPKLDNAEIIQKYISCMEEIKKRTEVVESIVAQEIHVKYIVTTAETAVLQIRKILELIALSSMAANLEQYRKKRANFHKDWKAKLILEDLEKVNPKFFPKPRKRHARRQGGWKLDTVKSGFLTKLEFIELYDRCSAFLHAENPFDDRDENMDIIKLLYQEIPYWMNKVVALLDHHTVQPVDENRMYAVIMRTEDGKVQMTELVRAECG